MILNLKSYLVVAAAAVALAACSSTPPYEFNPTTDFSRYKTFALMPLPTQGTASDPGAALRLAQPAREAVVAALAAKGFSEADRESADMAINLRGESVPQVEVRDYGYMGYPVGRRGYYGWAPHGITQISTTEERTLIIEVYDSQTKQIVWVGWSKSSGTGRVEAPELRKAINQILQPFPPGSETTAP